jgi:hypothetical protein
MVLHDVGETTATATTRWLPIPTCEIPYCSIAFSLQACQSPIEAAPTDPAFSGGMRVPVTGQLELIPAVSTSEGLEDLVHSRNSRMLSTNMVTEF